MAASADADKHIRGVAVFDFDGTLIDGQSGTLFTRFLRGNGMMSPGSFARLVWWGIRYKLHLPFKQEEARELVFGALRGRGSDEVDALMGHFHDEVLAPRYRPLALAEVRGCHDDGLVVLLVSATFAPIARLAAERIGADGFVATEMGHAVTAWCNAHLGPGAWRLERAYADHHTDADLLEIADSAYAVCPGKTLAISARKHGWPVLDWGA